MTVACILNRIIDDTSAQLLKRSSPHRAISGHSSGKLEVGSSYPQASIANEFTGNPDLRADERSQPGKHRESAHHHQFQDMYPLVFSPCQIDIIIDIIFMCLLRRNSGRS